jgi:hypothetical protein
MTKGIVATAVLVVCAGLVGCAKPATTEVKTVTKDIAHERSGKTFARVFVIVDARRAEGKKAFEEAFVKQFQDRKVQAVASLGILPAGEKITKERVVKAIKDTEIDAVFVVYIKEIKKEEVYQPAKVKTRWQAIDTYDGMLRGFQTTEVVPGYFKETEVVRVMSRLFDVETQKPVWSMMSETYDPEERPNNKTIAAFVKTVMDALFDKSNSFF